MLHLYSEYPAWMTRFSDDGRLAAVSDDTSIHVIDLSSGEALFEIDAF